MKHSLTLLLILPLVLFGQSTIIKDVTLLDVEARKLVSGTSVKVTDGEIERIDKFKKIKTAADDQIIDGSGKFLMPGLIDAHIHFFQSGGIYTRPDAIDLRSQKPYSEEIKFGKDNASDYLRRYLRLGITTVMDVGGPMWNFTVRDSIAEKMVAPNVLVTGPLFSIVDRPQMDEGDPPIIKVTSTEDIDELFNKMLAYNPDFIKVWYIASRQYPPEDSFPLVKYLGELCRSKNLLLAVHATQLKTAQLAVKAGANILVHSVDDEVIPASFTKQLKDQSVTYIPTLTVGNGYARTFTGNLNHTRQDLDWANPTAYNSLSDLEKIDSARWPVFIKRVYKKGVSSFFAKEDSIMKINLKNLTMAGVNIATGTDAGNIGTMHASSYMAELDAMSAAGLDNWDLLVSSTINPAKGFGIDDRTGSVSVGKQADLVMLTQNPLDDLRNLNDIELVVKSGIVLSKDSILMESPEQIVQRQVNAYNARDIEAFLATYTEDIEVYDEENKLIAKGQEQMRSTYAGMFETVTDLYCEIENRIVINNKVIDKEKVRFNGRYVNAVAIYEVSSGKISKVNFVE